MTALEIINFVEKALIEQGEKSVDPAIKGRCKYRQPLPSGKVLKCAVGHLVPDDRYNASIMEENTISCILREHPGFIDDLVMPSDLDVHEGVCLLVEIQRVHDLDNMTDWPKKFQYLRNYYGNKIKL